MGLDAGVYKNLRNASEELRKQVRLVNAETGEIDYEDELRLGIVLFPFMRDEAAHEWGVR